MASNPPSPPSSSNPTPPHSRKRSVSNANNNYQPANPSGLRRSTMPPESPEDKHSTMHGGNDDSTPAPPESMPTFDTRGIHPAPETPDLASEPELTHQAVRLEGPTSGPDVRTRLLNSSYHRHRRTSTCGSPNCDQGTLSPRPQYLRGYGSFGTQTSHDGYGGRWPGGPGDAVGGNSDNLHGIFGDAVADGLLNGGPEHKLSTTQWLAKRHGVKNPRLMYLLYYLPFTKWVTQYRWRYLQGDLIAALTMASFYIPMSLSYASNLAHIPPINGLYSFVFNPLIYAILGTCPQMVVGPEAAGSLLTGAVVRENIQNGKHSEGQDYKHAEIAGVVTGLAGAIILLAGLCRLGFLDSVLSRPFLRGFISAIGIVILVSQLIPEMGLDSIAAHSSGAAHGSSLEIIIFLFNNGAKAHGLTCAVSFGAFAVVMVLREVKRRLQPRLPWVAYVPDRFLVVVFSAVFAWKFSWDQQGLDILGDIKAKGRPFRAEFPFKPSMLDHITNALSTAFIIALLGFFESSVAAKSLGTGTGKTIKVKRKTAEGAEVEVEETEGITGMTVSPNRELVALGVANMLGGTFMALPAFGGYGRSKVNASTGGKTPMSSIFLSLITVVCILYLLPYVYFIPKGVLSAMISVVAYSLIEEAPSDLLFYYRISGYSELILMTLIFLTTFFWNLKIGIAVGIGLSLLRLLRHSTRPRIQILGRVPGTRDQFENAEMVPGRVEFIPHCLIVKIPEPLTFANTGSLKDRLRRLEDHGTSAAHPALPRVRREEHNQNVIFDVHGVTSLDPAASQVLLEIVRAYVERGTRVFFCRVPGRKTEVWRLMVVSGILALCGGEGHFVRSVEEALFMTEVESGMLNADGGREIETAALAYQDEAEDTEEREDTMGEEERRVGTG